MFNSSPYLTGKPNPFTWTTVTKDQVCTWTCKIGDLIVGTVELPSDPSEKWHCHALTSIRGSLRQWFVCKSGTLQEGRIVVEDHVIELFEALGFMPKPCTETRVDDLQVGDTIENMLGMPAVIDGISPVKNQPAFSYLRIRNPQTGTTVGTAYRNDELVQLISHA